jgi:DNA helicase II / ATP-dependent DNA helicase PcrA
MPADSLPPVFSFTPRPKQAEVLAYRRGWMGVSAVPGSGKTHTLSALAAQLIMSGVLDEDQEILIVTLVNSAVDNFAGRIGGFLKAAGMFTHLGYRVRTLHGLAHDLVRERPGLVGLADDFQIVDEHAASQILNQAAGAWLRANPFALDEYLRADLDDGARDHQRREKLPLLAASMAANFIRSAKDQQIEPDQLRSQLEALQVPLPLAEMGAAVYADYQRALSYRAAVDFDDLIRLALRALRLDEKFLLRLRQRWPFILEDEAQDSSRLQEEILNELAGPGGSWVRVGDPNQAIFETFTTANPRYLRDFIARPQVQSRQLPNSGRCSQDIIDLANALIDWTMSSHPWEGARPALSLPHIEPSPPGDPQPNPACVPEGVRLIPNRFTADAEVLAVAASLQRWLPEHPESTCAVLVPRNRRGEQLAAELEKRKIDYVDHLGSSRTTRLAVGALANVLSYLAAPQKPSLLARVYEVWRRAGRDDAGEKQRIERMSALIAKCTQVEDFLWPRLGGGWLESLKLEEDPDWGSAAVEELRQFRDLVCRWQGTALLPIDQAVLTLAQDLFSDPSDLALSHKLAVLLRQASQAHRTWRLPELTGELAVVARSERRFLGFSDDESGFDPQRYKGRVVITTVHKAKGLEWDRVYLMSVSSYDYPSSPQDEYISEPWYIRDRLNLEAETLEQLRVLLSSSPYEWYEEGSATEKARLEYVSERLRLLYVGITRARQELVITWNTGRRTSSTPAAAFLALQSYLSSD